LTRFGFEYALLCFAPDNDKSSFRKYPETLLFFMISVTVMQNIYSTFDSPLNTNPMKLRLSLLLLAIFISSIFATAQIIQNGFPVIPYSPNKSVLFGKDIIINNEPSQNQRNVTICSAFNGWLFAIYSYINSTTPYMAILKSTDSGTTWAILYNDILAPPGVYPEKIEAIVIGSSATNLKIILGFLFYSSITNVTVASVPIFNPNSGAFQNDILQETSGDIRDIALASDNLFPAINANPNSLAILYSKHEISDSIVFCSSSNGGISIDTRHDVAYSPKYINKVSLEYGRSNSFPTGRYFAAWEEKDDANSSVGHIYTAHSEPNFNSGFTAPKCLDSLDGSLINKCCNPVISCQVNNTENDSANLTEMVAFEKYVSSTNAHDLVGYYNKRAVGTTDFKKSNIAVTSHNEIEPDLVFNSFDNKFYMTYYDSTMQKLPLLAKDFNMANPDSWEVVSTGYNDSTNLISPHPKTEISQTEQKNCQLWVAERSNGNGKVLFDAEYSTYTGASEISSSEGTKLLGAYPNPCTSGVTIGFELLKSENVRISIGSITGQLQGIITDQVYSPGRHEVRADVSSLPEGIYIYKLQAGEFAGTGKIAIVR